MRSKKEIEKEIVKEVINFIGGEWARALILKETALEKNKRVELFVDRIMELKGKR